MVQASKIIYDIYEEENEKKLNDSSADFRITSKNSK